MVLNSGGSASLTPTCTCNIALSNQGYKRGHRHASRYSGRSSRCRRRAYQLHDKLNRGDERYLVPRSWAERAYPKLIYYTKHDKRSHFEAWEQPLRRISAASMTKKSSPRSQVIKDAHRSLGVAERLVPQVNLHYEPCDGSGQCSAGVTRSFTPQWTKNAISRVFRSPKHCATLGEAAPDGS